MADLPETAEWTPGIYQFETSDPVLGGPEGIDNRPSKQLANRTVWLKQRIASMETGEVVAGKASVLAQARTIAITGDASWSVSFNGGGNVTAALTLTNSGVAAGTYGKVSVNAKGLVVAGSALGAADIPNLDWSKITSGKPDTLAGYGVTIADQALAEAGTDNVRPMTALRVFQAIAKVVAQASESTFGWAKVATQAEVLVGTDDSRFVTPKKLRWGFATSLTTNGYIVFPSWLGGLILQWVTNNQVGENISAPLPIAFPNACLFAVVNMQSDNGAAVVLIRTKTELAGSALLGSTNATGTNTYNWFSIGY